MGDAAGDYPTGGMGTDIAAAAAAAAAGVDVVTTDASSNGTPSRRGSAASTATDQKLAGVEGDPDIYGEHHFRRRSSMMAPLPGGYDGGLGSTSGDGATSGTLTSGSALVSWPMYEYDLL